MREEKEQNNRPTWIMGLLIVAVLIALGGQQFASGSIDLSGVSWGIVAMSVVIAVACIIVVAVLVLVLLLVLRDRRHERNTWKHIATLQVYDRQQERGKAQQMQQQALGAVVEVVRLSAAERTYLYNQVVAGLRLVHDPRTKTEYLVYPTGETINAGELVEPGELTDEALDYIADAQRQLSAPSA